MPRLLKSIREALVSSKQWLRAVAAALLLGLSLTSTGAAPARADDVLNRGFGASPDTLDPHVNFGAREGWIQDDMYEGLVVMTPRARPIPGAAEKWEVSDDGLTWTFHLRDGLKWSNGDPLVAQDFVNGVIRQLDAQDGLAAGLLFLFAVPGRRRQGLQRRQGRQRPEDGRHHRARRQDRRHQADQARTRTCSI